MEANETALTQDTTTVEKVSAEDILDYVQGNIACAIVRCQRKIKSIQKLLKGQDLSEFYPTITDKNEQVLAASKVIYDYFDESFQRIKKSLED